MHATTIALLLMLAVLLPTVFAQGHTSSEWEGRRIYQILTDRYALSSGAPYNSCSNVNDYCGGTFEGAKEQLDYITGMGFNAIWISPVIVNTQGGYHGYWAKDFFKVNPHFGSQDSLQNFVQAAHDKGVWIMVDVVVNHAGPINTDYSQITPFNKAEYYHTDCQVTNYQCMTQEVYNCRLANLPDLNQTVPFVKQQLSKYVHWLFDTFDFDGIRADTVMYIAQQYWNDLSNDIGVFIAGEVWSDFNCNLQYTQYGIPATLNYPMYNTLRSVYQSHGSMRFLGTNWRQQKQYAHPNWEVNFLDNHDNDRFLNATNNIPAYKSALAQMFFENGIPCIYYGTEQYFSGGVRDNWNRQALWPTKYKRTDMYNFLASLNAIYDKFRVWKHDVNERWQDDTVYCYYRGNVLVCTTNTMDAQTRTLDNMPYSGKKLCDYFNPSNCVSGSTSMTITIPSGGNPYILTVQS